MKNLILMTNVLNNSSKGGGTHSHCKELYEYAIRKGKEWSDRIGCDFKCITDVSVFSDYSPTWQRMAIFLKLDEYNDYDNIVYVDADLVISKNAPDIFKIMDEYEHEFFACSDYPLPLRNSTNYFNAGLIGVKKSFINKCSNDYIHKKMKKYKNKNIYDQCCLNEIVKEKCDSYVQLSKSWNIFPPRDINMYSHFYGIHYVHYHKTKWNGVVKTKQMIRNIEKFEEEFNSSDIPSNTIKHFPEFWKSTQRSILELEAE